MVVAPGACGGSVVVDPVVRLTPSSPPGAPSAAAEAAAVKFSCGLIGTVWPGIVETGGIASLPSPRRNAARGVQGECERVCVRTRTHPPEGAPRKLGERGGCAAARCSGRAMGIRGTPRPPPLPQGLGDRRQENNSDRGDERLKAMLDQGSFGKDRLRADGKTARGDTTPRVVQHRWRRCGSPSDVPPATKGATNRPIGPTRTRGWSRLV